MVTNNGIFTKRDTHYWTQNNPIINTDLALPCGGEFSEHECRNLLFITTILAQNVTCTYWKTMRRMFRYYAVNVQN